MGQNYVTITVRTPRHLVDQMRQAAVERGLRSVSEGWVLGAQAWLDSAPQAPAPAV